MHSQRTTSACTGGRTWGAIVGIVVALLIWTIVAARARADGSGILAVDDSLRFQLNGAIIALPERDHFDRQMPRGERIVVVLSPCNSCSVTGTGSLKEPLSSRRLTAAQLPVVFVAQDADSGIIPAIKKEATAYLLLDRDQQLLPSIAYLVAPISLRVAASGHVLEIMPW